MKEPPVKVTVGAVTQNSDGSVAVQTFNFNSSMLRESEYPNLAGWWARYDGGKISWFFVEHITDDDHPGGYLAIYLEKIRSFVRVEAFSVLRCRWAGPVALPWH